MCKINVRISRKADLEIEKIKILAKKKNIRGVSKGDILNYIILEVMKHPSCEKSVLDWLERQK